MKYLKLLPFTILFFSFQASAINLVAGPGWSTSDRAFQYSRELLIQHLNATHYPEFLYNTGLETIILHPGPLMLRGESVGGYADSEKINMVGISEQNLTNCTSGNRRSIYRLPCEVDSTSIDYNTTRVLLTFNHELFHIIDFNVNKIRKSINSQWNQLNPPGFEYSSDPLDAPLSVPRFDQDGSLHVYSPSFISEYGSRTISEDKAEIFALALLRPTEFFTRAAFANPVIAAKYGLIRRMLDAVTRNNPAIIPLPLQGQGD